MSPIDVSFNKLPIPEWAKYLLTLFTNALTINILIATVASGIASLIHLPVRPIWFLVSWHVVFFIIAIIAVAMYSAVSRRRYGIGA